MEVKFEIINHDHPQINIETRPERFACIAFPNEKNVYFTNAATEQLGIKAGQYIHFAILDTKLYFYFNDDPKGFKLSSSGGNASPTSKSVRTDSKRLMQYLLQRFDNIKTGKRFKYRITESKVGDSNLIEVLFDQEIKHKEKFVPSPRPKGGSVFSQIRNSQLK